MPYWHEYKRSALTLLNRTHNPNNEYVTSSSVSAETLVSHFNHLYEDRDAETQPLLNFRNAGGPLFQVNEDMVDMFIKTLKNRKSPGPDDITNEYLKYGGNLLVQQLTRGSSILF